jgi:DNA-binding transcriptional MerR regulator/methylmalonyl-CoA mutase cobalamin-binding subunit
MNTHRIHRVAKITGFSRDVIRVWERRYGLLKPMRGPNRYRLYTDEDVALLRYIRTEMDKGQAIGQLAAAGRVELLTRARIGMLQAPREIEPYERVLAELIAALDPLDQPAFERRLNGAVAVIPFEEALRGILLPLQQRVGEMWHDGRVGVAVEHYVTKQVQQKLFAVMNQLQLPERGPKVLVAAPPGELHEIGAQSVAYVCAVRGCRVYYLGPNLPVEAMAKLCAEVRPDLVLLSFSAALPAEDAAGVVRELAEQVSPICPIAAGGAGARTLREILERGPCEVLEDFAALDRRLGTLPRR